jgi:hypothetical protein
VATPRNGNLHDQVQGINSRCYSCAAKGMMLFITVREQQEKFAGGSSLLITVSRTMIHISGFQSL